MIDLTTQFTLPDGVIRAVDNVNFTIGRGEVVAVVGESGSGKSVTALSVMRLVPEPPGKIVGGKVLLEGEDLLTKSKREMQAIRGRRIGMIFQNPYTALNPLLNIGRQLIEVLRMHRDVSRREAADVLEELLLKLGTREPLRILQSRPYQASGGTNQRVMLALALLGKPELLIADEPTTMLDAITQMDIFEVIRNIKEEMGMAVWLITHDFGAVALMADKVVVMYAGSPVEWSDAKTILKHPKHPYTAGLVRSVPALGTKCERLFQIPGEPADLSNLPNGCRFAPRCPRAMAICRAEAPPTLQLPDATAVRCWLYGDAGTNP